MAIKEKAVSFVSEYNQELAAIQNKISETERRLEDLELEIRFIQEVDLPRAVERRVLTGDQSQENKVRKQLDKLQVEKKEKNEDLIVFQSVLSKFKQKKADDLQQIRRLFQEELTLVSRERLEKLAAAKETYKQALKAETELLHFYRDIDRDLQQVLVNAKRMQNASVGFPISQLDLKSLAIDFQEINRITKRLK